MTRGPALCAALLLFFLVGTPGLARGQPSCGGGGGVGGGGDQAPAPSARAWPAPLDRVVSLQARDVSLRDALDRLSAAARVRFSYSAELLPLDRSVCVVRASVRVGDALADLLRGTAVEPVVAGADQVVLAPAAGPRAAAAARGDVPDDSDAAGAPPAAMARSVGVLERVVVTGSAVGGSQRGLAVALGVVEGKQLARRNVTSLSQILDGAVPGVWAWAQSPSTLLARYGSIRGASSFGVSYPKVYIDGIEVANPLLVTQLDPEGVERIEVIRGPQGAALYGADAISGVINVVTRHGGAQDGAARLRLRSTGGVSETEFAARPAVAQEHALTLRAGSGLRTATLGVWAASVGEFVPDVYARRLTASGGLRLVGARSSVSATARLFAARAGVGTSPILSAARDPAMMRAGSAPWTQQQQQQQQQQQHGEPSAPADTAGANSGPQSALQYTLGTTLTVARGERWTHAVVLGADGYRLSGVPDDDTAAEPALAPATAGADRASVRASSVVQLVSRDDASAALTLAAEHSQLRERPAADGAGGWGYASGYGGAPPGGGREGGGGGRPGPGMSVEGMAGTPLVEWRASTGVFAQMNAALRDALYLTGGLRLEHNEAFEDAIGFEALPMLGAALVRPGPLGTTVKLRAAYGKGIRSPRTAIRETTQPGVHPALRRAGLAPERQSGVEVGADLFVGKSLSFQLTRFDQIASGLIQRVTLPRGPRGSPGPSGTPQFVYLLQNIGEIANRGWELQGSLAGRGALRPLSLAGTLSLVDSRVQRTAFDYQGDLRPGDRMLEVPKRTAGLTALWSTSLWSGSVTASRAANWINYDRVALARAYANAEFGASGPTGADLRGFWQRYDGVTRLRASTSLTVRRGLSLQLTSENLLGQQRGEPDNVTVLPGRTVTGGVMVEF
ncbi:MAG TPA: TonB-dependent receptor [Gemmatimonadaceae bacterium]|nr:TonB-dependent receptor [Gemmatimonadaceae bacterium]